MADETSQPDLTSLTVSLLSAFVANNSVRVDELSKLIGDTHAALARLSTSTSSAPAAEAAPAAEEFRAAVSARRSLGSRDHILSMIDGKPYKTLKRHLARHGLSPDEYRARYNLPRDYPMVAPAYSEARRETAKRLGLGRKRGDAAPTARSRGRSARAK